MGSGLQEAKGPLEIPRLRFEDEYANQIKSKTVRNSPVGLDNSRLPRSLERKQTLQAFITKPKRISLIDNDTSPKSRDFDSISQHSQMKSQRSLKLKKIQLKQQQIMASTYNIVRPHKSRDKSKEKSPTKSTSRVKYDTPAAVQQQKKAIKKGELTFGSK